MELLLVLIAVVGFVAILGGLGYVFWNAVRKPKD
jgi:flagellar basal body-associated protein FliL